MAYPGLEVDLVLGLFGALGFGIAALPLPSWIRALAMSVGIVGLWQGFAALPLGAGPDLLLLIIGGVVSFIGGLIALSTHLSLRTLTARAAAPWKLVMIVALMGVSMCHEDRAVLTAMSPPIQDAPMTATDFAAQADETPRAAPLSGATCGEVVTWKEGKKTPSYPTYTQLDGSALWLRGTCEGVLEGVVATAQAPRGLLERVGPAVAVVRRPSEADFSRRMMTRRGLSMLLPLSVLVLGLYRRRADRSVPEQDAEPG